MLLLVGLAIWICCKADLPCDCHARVQQIRAPAIIVLLGTHAVRLPMKHAHEFTQLCHGVANSIQP